MIQVRTEALAAGSGHARESIWQYFVTKCSNNLHIVLAMSPVGDALRTRCRNFPGTLLVYFETYGMLLWFVTSLKYIMLSFR